MSLEAYEAVWTVNASGAYNTPSTLLVALAMAAAHDRRRNPEPWTVRKLAGLTGLSVGAVSEAITAIRQAGPFERVLDGAGRHGATYALAFSGRTLDPVDNQPVAFSGRTQTKPVVFSEANATPNGPKDITRDARVAKETNQPTVGLVGIPVLTSERNGQLPEPDTADEAERLEARAAALNLGRQAVKHASVGEPLPPVPRLGLAELADARPDGLEAPEDWPEGVTRPENVAAHVAGLRANVRRPPRRWRSDYPHGGEDE